MTFLYSIEGPLVTTCVVQALLKNCRVLVMDEASSSCDPDTDLVIQVGVPGTASWAMALRT